MRLIRLLLVGSFFLGLAACSGLDTNIENRSSVLEGGVFGDLRARKPRPISQEPQGLIRVDEGVGKSEIFNASGEGSTGTAYAPDGQGGTASAAADGADGEGGDAYKLNFENADIRDVIRAVLGDALQLNYTIAPEVNGLITISSVRSVSRDELLSVLEAMLAPQGFAIKKSGDYYRVGAAAPGGGVVDRGTRTSPGYGVSIVPLRYVSVSTMSRLLAGFVVDAEGLKIDSTRNAVIVAGPSGKREEVVQTVLSFDEDFMKDQTVGLFEVRRVEPNVIIPELERIFESNSSAKGVIQFKPITRLKSIMVVSRNAALVRRAETWVRRLDKENVEAGQSIYVYRARYRSAKDLASITGNLFGGGGSSLISASSGETGSSGEGFELGGDASAEGEELAEGEAPIDDVTGAGEEGDPSFEDDGSAPPDVLDLTSGGRSGGGKLRISADESNNTVIIYADAPTYRKVLAALNRLDTEPIQVAISATIAEVKLNDELRYGVQYFVRSGALGLDKDEGSISLKDTAAAISSQVPGFNFLIGSNKNPDVIVSALDKITDVEILSSPSLMVLENQQATLTVGEEVPVSTRQAQNIEDPNARVINEIDYKNVGILLRVTPRVGNNGSVTMKIEQEISSVVGTSTQTPTISKRRVDSNVSVNDGQTVVLAGLIDTKKDNRRNGVPILNRLRGVQDALGDTGKNASRTELIILIRPQIVRNGEDAQSVAEDLRSRMWAIGNRERSSP